VRAGALAEYITRPQQIIQVEPQSGHRFSIELQLPPELKEGIYPIIVDVAEQASGGGMSALTGVASTINVISQYAEGFPYTALNVKNYQTLGDPIKFSLSVRNIGQTALTRLQAEAKLVKDGKTFGETTIDPLQFLQPNKQTVLRGLSENIDDIEPGYYQLEVELGPNEFSRKIAIGTPKLRVDDTPTITPGQDNDIEITLHLDDWNSPIENVDVTGSVFSLFKSEQTVTLQPGPNKLTFSGYVEPAKAGTYKGRVAVVTPITRNPARFDVLVEGGDEGSGAGFRSILGSDSGINDESETIAGKALELEGPQETKDSKTNIFLIVLLIASIGLFAFALGRYFSGGNRNEPEIPAP